jgi:hypothetical protein
MVGATVTRRWGEKVVKWLETGGRDKVYDLAEELEERYRGEGILGGFSCHIGLPTDVMVHYRRKGERSGLLYTFSAEESSQARREAEIYNLNPPGPDFEASVLSGKEVYDLQDDEVFTNFNWYGHEGAVLIFQAIGRLIEKETGVAVRL